MTYAMAFLIGVVAGLRTMTAPAVVSWAARLGWLHLEGTPVAFLGAAATPWIFTAAALAELVFDVSPKAGSRRRPRCSSCESCGALSGAAIGASGQALAAGLVLGAAGAVAGTLGGSTFRARLATAFGRDLPAALTEDALGIVLAICAVRFPR